MLSIEDGAKLVRLARSTIEKSFKTRKFKIEKVLEKSLKEKNGIFVTIETFPGKNLRGCIGFTSPNWSLSETVQRAAYCSAFEDTRFEPLRQDELNNIIIEVSVMTKPELIKVKNPNEYAKKIEIGKDGLIMVCGSACGLLLPQVPIEFGWDVEEFLENLCYKSNLTPDFVHDKQTKIWKFQSQIFAEKEPRGEVAEIKLTKHSS